MARISIIGSGVVGTAVGMGFKKLGNAVIFYDISESRALELKSSGVDATTDIKEAIQTSDISFVSVPTPSNDGKIDLSFIKSVSKQIGEVLKEKEGYHIVVIKSTVVPTTTEKVVKPIIEESSNKRCGEDFGLAMNPEFLTEIHKSWSNDPGMSKDFFSEERIVIGESDKKAGDILEELYSPLGFPILRTDTKTAEMIKYASNCILASRIIPWYDFKPVCEKIGVDIHLVSDIVSKDSRIGKYGSVITGRGYQGKCLPKDVKAFISFAREHGCEPTLFEVIDGINDKIQEGIEDENK